MYDELIKNLRGRSQFLLPHYGEETSYDSDLMKQAADAIEGLSKLNAEIARRELKLRMEKPRWVSVTERLPEEYETVLLLSMGGEVISGYYDSEYKSYCDMSGFRKLCTHWMPLPEPPVVTDIDVGGKEG